MSTRIELFKDDPTDCPQCSAVTIEEKAYSETIDFRGMTLDVSGMKRYRCSTCGFDWRTPSQRAYNMALLREEYGVQRDEIRRRDGLLSGEEIAKIRNKLNLGKSEASQLFGGGPKSFNKYETGEVLQSFAMDRLIRLAGHFGTRALAFLQNVGNETTTYDIAAMPSEDHGVKVVVIEMKAWEEKFRLSLGGANLKSSWMHQVMGVGTQPLISQTIAPTIPDLDYSKMTVTNTDHMLTAN